MNKQHLKPAIWVIATLLCCICWLWVIAVIVSLINPPI